MKFSKHRTCLFDGFLGGVLGFFSSQYFPVFGSFEKFAAPFSPLKMTLLPSHILCGALLGFFIPFILIKEKNK